MKMKVDFIAANGNLFSRTIIDLLLFWILVIKKILLRKIVFMNELNKELKNQARHLGLCDEWTNLWNKDWSNEKMVERMYKGLDFCLKHHWPSNDFIVKHFDQEFRRNSNVFVDDKYSINNPKESLILGKSDITARFNGANNGTIHIRDNSSVKLSAKNRSFVIVHLYENAYIDAEQFDRSIVVLIKHSEKVTIIADKAIRIREEYDYLK